MANWEDEEDDDYGDVPEFDPAKSAVNTNDPQNHLHIVLKRMFIEHYNKEHAGQINDTEELFKKFFGKNFLITETYVKRLIKHYYESELPFEDDLEPVDEKNFPTNKEIKRFIKTKDYSYIDFDAIDRYCNSQPSNEDKEAQLKSLHSCFKMLKYRVSEYYPQLEKLPARGFRELERSLYTINYLLWIDLHEAVERHLGINKEYYNEMDRQLAQKRKEREERKKANKNEGESWLEKWEKMTDEEKEERERIWEEREKLERRALNFINRMLVEISKTFIEFYPELDLPYENFLAKADRECWLTYSDTFYIVHKMVEHYKITDEAFKDKYPPRMPHECPIFDIYKRMKEKNVAGAVETFLDCLDENDRLDVIYEIQCGVMGNIWLSIIYETFPDILNFTPDAMIQIKNKVFSLARYNVPELYDVRDRLLKVDTEIYEKMDNRTEEYQRKKFEGEK